jgi:hypothetical protein
MALSVTLLLLLINVRLYHPDMDGYGIKEIGPDVLPQLHFVKIQLVEGSGEEMQALFPEGYFFSYALYGLSWVNIGIPEPYGSELQQEALRDARWALEHLESPVGKAPFNVSATLTPPYGVFYVGWSTWLRGGILLLQPAEARDPDEIARFQADCMALAEAFEDSSTPFLTSYPNRAWPVDSVVAVAALRLHDKLFAPPPQSGGMEAGRFAPTIERWIEQAKAQVDPETGLLPHYADPQTGEPLQGARGTSQSMIARFLLEIDSEWGHDEYMLFREQFVTSRLALPGVREYPLGVEGAGDVDSGPLLLDVSLSATVVTLGAALLYGDRMLAEPLLQAGEVLGFPLDLPLFPSDSFTGIETKRYALGQFPIGDGLLVWSKSAYPWVVDPITVLPPPVNPIMWREQWRRVSAVVIILLFCWPFRGRARQWVREMQHDKES